MQPNQPLSQEALVEALTFAALGMIAAIPMAWWTSRLVGNMLLSGSTLRATISMTPDVRVLAISGLVTMATGLFHPWSLAFLPDGRLLVAERDGHLRMIRNDALQSEVVWTSPTPPGQGADALHGLAVHPRFAQNGLVYVSYPKNGPRGNTLAVARGHLQGATLAEVTEIFVADAWETSGNLGGHMMFGPDSTLYVMVGDRDRLCCTGTEDNSLRMKAQALDNHVGKTLRLKDDGGVPADVGIVADAGAALAALAEALGPPDRDDR